ncbi:MAG: amidohydrolase [Clostridia bacterium]|nr:amidohydrolase [Clostridia bacterium]
MRAISPDKDYIISIRRELHRYPEVGFDLPKTLSIIRRELDKLGIPYTERYGKSSIVATLAKGRGTKVIALRADIDALPIKEDTGLEFASLHDGMMHACGHDTHCAMLLGAAKMLKACEGELPCEVRLFFQAAEEYAPGGAKLMCEDGCMDDVDAIIGAHIDPDIPLGTIALNYGAMSASSHGFYLDFKGRSCHVSTPQKGVDAIAMACRAFMDIQVMRARELDPKAPVVLGIGEFHGGNANNVVCDSVHLHGTIRATSNPVDEYVYRRIGEIAESVARDMGGSAEITTSKHYPSIINDPKLAKNVVSIGKRLLGEEAVDDNKECMMGGEDFAFYTLRKPGVFFHIGMRSNKYEFAPWHNPKFIVDEDALTVGPEMFFAFAMEYGKDNENA